MENQRKQQKIADAYQQHHADNRQRLMPDEPRLYLMLHPLFQKMAIEGTTPERHRPKKKRHQQFAPPIMTEPERLQQIEYQKDNHTVEQTLFQPVLALLKRIFPG
jgi:hypothetical protein